MGRPPAFIVPPPQSPHSTQPPLNHSSDYSPHLDITQLSSHSSGSCLITATNWYPIPATPTIQGFTRSYYVHWTLPRDGQRNRGIVYIRKGIIFNATISHLHIYMHYEIEIANNKYLFLFFFLLLLLLLFFFFLLFLLRQSCILSNLFI